MPKDKPPILSHKYTEEASVFLPENLLREARRQLERPKSDVPATVVLDPDGDLADYLIEYHNATFEPAWACYHSRMYTFELLGQTLGIIPRVVGASYAVLVAEQLKASGCTLLISITSAGIITAPDFTQAFGLIAEAVRDEGTSYHYLAPDVEAKLPEPLLRQFWTDLPPNTDAQLPYHVVKSWTTDAPYRETSSAIRAMAEAGVTCVEMESSALLAFGMTSGLPVLCFAHLTNEMAQNEGDFEKGEHAGSLAARDLIDFVLQVAR